MHLIPKESEVPMIKEIFSMLDYKTVCDIYDISPATYYNIRKNKFYAGYISYKGKEKKGIHEPLITLERWQMFNS